MGSKLAALGRSHAFSSGVSNIANMAIQLKGLDLNEKRLDQQQAIDLRQHAIDLRKMQLLENADIRAESASKREAASAEVDLNKKKIELDAIRKREAILDKEYDITVDPRFMAMPPEAQKDALTWFSTQGYTDEKGKGKVRNIVGGLQTFETTKGAFGPIMGKVVEHKKALVVESYNALQEAIAKGNEKKIAEAQAIYKKARNDYNASNDGYEKHLQKLEELEIKEKNKVGSAKKVLDKTSPTGWSWEYEDGTVRQGAPPPASAVTAEKDHAARFTREAAEKRLELESKYNLTREEIQVLEDSEGADVGFVTKRMSPAQAKSFIEELNALSDEYDEGVRSGKYKWGLKPSSPAGGGSGEEPELTYDPKTRTFK